MELREQNLKGKEIEYSLISTSNDCKWKLRCASNAIEEFMKNSKDRDYDSVVRAINRALEIDVITYPAFLYTEDSRKAYNEFLENLYKFVLCESVIDKSSIYDLDNVKRFMRTRVQKQINDFENSSTPYDIAMRLNELERENNSDKYLDKKLMGLLYFNSNLTKELKEGIINKELDDSFKHVEELNKKINSKKKEIKGLKKAILITLFTAGTALLGTTSLFAAKVKKESKLKYSTQTIYEDLSISDLETTSLIHDNSKPIEKEKTIVRVYSPVVNGEFTESIYDYTDSGVPTNNLLNGELSDAYLVSRTTHSVSEYPEEIMNVYKNITNENRAITKSKYDSKTTTTNQYILLMLASLLLQTMGCVIAPNATFMKLYKKELKEYQKELELENSHIVAITIPTYKEAEIIDIDEELNKEKSLRKALEK